MMKNKLIGLLLIFTIISLTFVYTHQLKQPEEPTYQRKNLTKFKGIWLTPSPNTTLKQDLLNYATEIKDLGVNIIAMCVPYCVNGDKIEPIVYGPPLQGEKRDKFIIEQITTAHQQGFAVFLELNTMHPGGDMEIQNKDKFINEFINESKKWAEIAETYQVELFSPLNEPNLVLTGKEFEWAQKVLPEIREVYKGEIVLKMGGMGPETEGNYSGYDYVAFDIYPYEVDKWRETVKAALNKMQKIIQTYNLKGGIFGELGAATKYEEVGQLFAGIVVDEDTQAQIFQTVFEEAWDQLKGFFITSWSINPDCPYNIRGLKAEEIIKEWYTTEQNTKSITNVENILTLTTYTKNRKTTNRKHKEPLFAETLVNQKTQTPLNFLTSTTI